MLKALDEAYSAGLLGKNACGSGYDFDIKVSSCEGGELQCLAKEGKVSGSDVQRWCEIGMQVGELLGHSAQLEANRQDCFQLL
jgi:hypothetical protein